MKRLLLLTLVSVAASAAVSTAHAAGLSAAQIVDRNVAARGGLKAWQAVTTLTMSGKLEAGGTKNTALPFVMEMKRPHKSRLEITFRDKTAVQVYDGTNGWKVRPFLNRDEVENFTPTEAKAAADWQDLDGPLVDYAAKGTKVEAQGMESVEGHKAYKLKLTLKDGTERHVWIDASTFLERRIDGDPRKIDGRMHNVAVYYRDYKKTANGLTVPHTYETVVLGVKQAPHKMFIEQVKVNQPLDDGLFGRPQLTVAKAENK